MRGINERLRNGSDTKLLFKYFLSGKNQEVPGALREGGVRMRERNYN